MTEREQWKRVSRNKPCPICERPDWCLLASDGAAVICARVESAKRCGEAGWLHRLVERPWQLARRIARSVPHTPRCICSDLESLVARCQSAVMPAELDRLALSLGLIAANLAALRIGWATTAELRQANTSCRSAGCWSFPMVDAAGRVCGVRLRTEDGCKYALKGGSEGLFLSSSEGGEDTLLVVEGPTDTAALWHMGFRNVAGRPSCTGGVKLLVELAQQRRPREVVIVADADEPGRRGANNLASVLVAYVPAVRVIEPPAGVKDVQAWLRAGGARGDVEGAIAAATARRLKIRTATAEKG